MQINILYVNVQKSMLKCWFVRKFQLHLRTDNHPITAVREARKEGKVGQGVQVPQLFHIMGSSDPIFAY